MSLSTWFMWALLLMVQNASFTWVSRARNSGSRGYHAVASIFSNGIWWVNQFAVIGIASSAIGADNLRLAIGAGLFYVMFTTIGAVLMQDFLIKRIEKGNRRVGA